VNATRPEGWRIKIDDVIFAASLRLLACGGRDDGRVANTAVRLGDTTMFRQGIEGYL